MELKCQIIIYMTLLLFATYTDLKRFTIPNWLTVSGSAAGIVFHSFFSAWQGLLLSLLGMLVGFSILLVLYLIHAVGAGDVKLFAAIGSIVGTEAVIYCLLYSIVYAGLLGIFYIAVKKQLWQRGIYLIGQLTSLILIRHTELFAWKQQKHHLRFPFMYAVFPASVTVISELFL